MVQFSYLRAQLKAETPRAALSPDAELARAIVMPAVFVAMADGEIQPVEQQELHRILEHDADVSRVASDGVNIPALVAELKADVQARDPDDLIEEAYEMLNDARATRAIEYALRVANADGDFDVEEQGTLMGLAKNFGVTTQQINEMLQGHAAPASHQTEAV